MSDVEAILQEALELGEIGDVEGMLALLHEGLQDSPDHAELLCWCGVAEREVGNDGDATDLFRRCLATSPEDPLILALAGNGLAASDDPEAEGALRTAALLAPTLPEARLYYGAFLAREGLLEDGLRELDAAKALDPDDSIIALERGVALALSGNPEAQMEFARTVDLDPEDGWAHVLLGLATLEFGERGEGSLEEAVAWLESGARLREDDVEAQFLASLALGLLGRDSAAWEMLERGRMHAQGTDREIADAIEERLEAAEGNDELLMDALLPMAWRDRLMARP
jgi:tetratricopeptide (TPR) repeat protein